MTYNPFSVALEAICWKRKCSPIPLRFNHLILPRPPSGTKWYKLRHPYGSIWPNFNSQLPGRAKVKEIAILSVSAIPVDFTISVD